MNRTKYCAICNGHITDSTTTFTVDLEFGVVVVRHVPALVCEQCGAEWISDADTIKLEKIVDKAKEKHAIVEVSEFDAFKKKAS